MQVYKLCIGNNNYEFRDGKKILKCSFIVLWSKNFHFFGYILYNKKDSVGFNTITGLVLELDCYKPEEDFDNSGYLWGILVN